MSPVAGWPASAGRLRRRDVAARRLEEPPDVGVGHRPAADQHARQVVGALLAGLTQLVAPGRHLYQRPRPSSASLRLARIQHQSSRSLATRPSASVIATVTGPHPASVVVCVPRRTSAVVAANVAPAVAPVSVHAWPPPAPIANRQSDGAADGLNHRPVTDPQPEISIAGKRGSSSRLPPPTEQPAGRPTSELSLWSAGSEQPGSGRCRTRGVGHAVAVVVLAVRARGRGLAAARDRRDQLGDLEVAPGEDDRGGDGAVDVAVEADRAGRPCRRRWRCGCRRRRGRGRSRTPSCRPRRRCRTRRRSATRRRRPRRTSRSRR